MNLNLLKRLTQVFYAGVAGVALSFLMTLILGVIQMSQKSQPQAPHFIPTPAQEEPSSL